MWRSLHSSPLRLIGYYLNEPMFYIRACDYITTLLIFRGSAGGQGALSRLTSGSQEPEPQCGTWQWMSPNDLDGICYTAQGSQSLRAIWPWWKSRGSKINPTCFRAGWRCTSLDPVRAPIITHRWAHSSRRCILLYREVSAGNAANHLDCLC